MKKSFSEKYGAYMFLGIIAVVFVAAVIARNMPANNVIQKSVKSNDQVNNAPANAVQDNSAGGQVFDIGLRGGNYYPQQIDVKYGEPVVLRNDGSLAGCALYVNQPQLGINANFAKNKEYKFTPMSKGTFVYTCSMGMYKGTLNVL